MSHTDQKPVATGYEKLDFGTGVTRLSRTANTWAGNKGDNRVEVRLDAPDGPLLGTFIAPSVSKPAQVEMAVTEKVSGVHDLYLVNIFDDHTRVAGNQWVNVKEFRFE